MCHEAPLAEEFFAKLLGLDEKIARQVKVAGCQRCGGPLHRADYVRKPRGGCDRCRWGGVLVATFALLRQSVLPQTDPAALAAVPGPTGVPGGGGADRRHARAGDAGAEDGTRGDPGARADVASLGEMAGRSTSRSPSTWIALRARFTPPPPEIATLPKSLLDWLAASRPRATRSEVLALAARLLAPATTTSVPDGSRFVIAAVGA